MPKTCPPQEDAEISTEAELVEAEHATKKMIQLFNDIMVQWCNDTMI